MHAVFSLRQNSRATNRSPSLNYLGGKKHMQKSFGFFGALAALMLSGSSSGQIDPSQPTLIGAEEYGFQFGVRSGYAIPLGSAYGPAGQTGGGADFKDLIKGMIPIWGDVGYRFNPNW